jgi:D-alanyl-D-alanine carboxypeptidase/D-alanyl-D-alanine-endopeptidase (penicillin-binding protein 4)
MTKKFLSLLSILVCISVQMYSQSAAEKLKKKMNTFLNGDQLKHAVVSMYVTDTDGNKIFALNPQYGLAPASTQKIFTAIAAFSLLGKDFSYKTEIGYNGTISNGELKGDLIIKGYGDPTLGSWRYAQTKPDSILHFFTGAIKDAGIKKIRGNIILDDDAFSYNALPGGYIWDDMGNYYGSGIWAINWRENQYDLILKPGNNIGDTSTLLRTNPPLAIDEYNNFITTAQAGTGDNTILYAAPYSEKIFAEGTIPKGVNEFEVSGSLPYAAEQLKRELDSTFKQNHIEISGDIITGASLARQNISVPSAQNNIATYNSPTLDSIVYWFLQKSINLYGEALEKTIAYKQDGFGSTINGVYEIKKFWQQNGIDSSSINIYDGSGLSPQNRVTTFAEVSALLYAQKQPWFQSFYNALPVYNGMKLKSGSISNVRSFTGYHTASNGKKYVVSIMVNNYDDSKGSVTQKIFNVLDALK